MNQKRYLALLATIAATPAFAAPFLAIGENAELFLTAETSIRHEDNVTFAANNKIADEIFEFAPGFDVVFGKSSLFSGNFGAFERFVAYSDNTTFNDNLTNLFFNSAYEGAKTKVAASASYSQKNQADRSIAGLGLQRSEDTAANFSVEHTITEKSKVAVATRYAFSDYDNPLLTDRKTYTLPVNYYFAVRPTIDLSAGVQYRKTDVNLGFDTEDYYFNVGARGEFTPKLRGSFSIGYNLRESDAPVSNDESSLGLSSGLTYLFSPKTQFSLDMSRDFDTGGDGFGTERSQITLGGRTSPTVALSLFANLTYSDVDYLAINRNDDFLSFNVGASYLVNRHLTVAAGYTIYDNSSSGPAAGPEFTANIFSLSASFRY